MVGSRQEGIEERRAFSASDQENRSNYLSAEGNFARRTLAGGFSRGQGAQGADYRRQRISQNARRYQRQSRRGQGIDHRVEFGHRQPSADATIARLGRNFSPRRN